MDDLLLEDVGAVRLMKLNRPDKLNAFDDSLSNHLIEALTQASAEDSVHCIVITGEGRGFSSGLDLSRFQDGSVFPESRHGRLDELAWVGQLVHAIVKNDKPVIAAINGVAAGAGLSIALACDMRLMADTAVLTTGYIRRALSPDAGMTYFLPRLIGHAKAAEWILTGRNIDATEADKLGLLNGVLEESALLEQTLAFATRVAAAPPIAVTLSKRLLVDAHESTLDLQLRRELLYLKQCFVTNDVREGIEAMMERREPKFTGR